jgi:hypothetical protein
MRIEVVDPLQPLYRRDLLAGIPNLVPTQARLDLDHTVHRLDRVKLLIALLQKRRRGRVDHHDVLLHRRRAGSVKYF